VRAAHTDNPSEQKKKHCRFFVRARLEICPIVLIIMRSDTVWAYTEDSLSFSFFSQ
jgi:hypothetical protein